jgi:hypothetical protein
MVATSVIFFVKAGYDDAGFGGGVQKSLVSQVKADMGNFVFADFKKNHIPFLQLVFGDFDQFGVHIGGTSAVRASVDFSLNFADQAAAVNAFGGSSGISVGVLNPGGHHGVEFGSLYAIRFNGDRAHQVAQNAGIA